MNNKYKMALLLVEDAVTKHDNIDDINIYDPGKVTMNLYSLESCEWPPIINHYVNDFPDADVSFNDEDRWVFMKQRIYIYKFGYDKSTGQYFVILHNLSHSEYSQYDIIWFNGSYSQFWDRWTLVNDFIAPQKAEKKKCG